MGVQATTGAAAPAPSGSRGAANAKRRQLIEQWRLLYRSAPPPKLPSCWLRMAVAFRVQERAHGTLKPSLRRQLEQLGSPSSEASVPTTSKLAAGSVLVREWQGVSHTVTILDKGVSYDGKLYRSLTAVADAITGAHWSGPQFFGLNAKRLVIRNDKASR